MTSGRAFAMMISPDRAAGTLAQPRRLRDVKGGGRAFAMLAPSALGKQPVNQRRHELVSLGRQQPRTRVEQDNRALCVLLSAR
jgi:hypothetical protein